jgi:hypothetical protein
MKLLKRILKKEAGQALPMALILLVLGGLLVVPTLGLVSTSLIANRQVDAGNLELYAADAGVEQVIWHIDYDPGYTLPTDSSEHPVTVPQVNGRTIVATISQPTAGGPYRIISTATSPNGHSTIIQSFVSADNYAFFFDAAATSAGDITVKPNAVISNNNLPGTVAIQYAGTKDIAGNATITGDVVKNTNLPSMWPTCDELTSFYSAEVATAPTFPGGTISVTGSQSYPTQIGLLNCLADTNLSGNGNWAKLNGTLFVNGNLGSSPFVSLDLNGHTIFATGNIDFSSGITIIGSGCLIGCGDVMLKPNADTSSNDFVFVLAVTGNATLKPGGTLYGSIAGGSSVVNEEVYVSSKARITLEPVPSAGLDFPGMNSGGPGPNGSKSKILSYTITPGN